MSKQPSIASFFSSPSKRKQLEEDTIDLSGSPHSNKKVKSKNGFKSPESKSSSSEQKENEKSIDIVSWNTDGLDMNLVQERAGEIVSILLSFDGKDPDSICLPTAIFLQEVVPDTYHIFRQRFIQAGYQCVPDEMPNAPYFTLAFVRQPIMVDAVLRETFSKSTMGRDMIVVQGDWKGVPLLLLTSHLESLSGDTNSKERCRQFSLVLERLTFFEEGLAIFCGDTNLREKEVKNEPLVKQVKDAWVEAGSSKDQKYTWDMKVNTNKQMPGTFQPRMRIDRCYINKSHEHKTAIEEYRLLGTSQMAEGLYPSDHFGLFVRLKIL